MGLIAGPESPPVILLSRGLRVSASIDMARKVFTRLTASAPASAATFAMCAIEVTLGESFTISGRVASRLGLPHQILQRARIGTKDHSACMNIGAGDIQLVGGNAFGLVKPFDHRDVVGHRVSEDIHDAPCTWDSASSGGSLLLR